MLTECFQHRVNIVFQSADNSMIFVAGVRERNNVMIKTCNKKKL